MPVPVLDETEIPEVDTQKLTNSFTLKSGQKLSYYDEDGDGRSDVLYVEGTGDIYDTTRGFPDSTYVKKVVVSEGITSIGNYNFDGFGALEDVTLPSTLTKIGDRAFSYCTKLKTIKIPTGIRAWMEDNWVLSIYPRSGLGFKFRMQLNNTVGIIDSDYYNSDNEGHIFIKITNDTKQKPNTKE